ncbi:MAG: hypothetical protein ACI4S2_04195 [Lachnospiraceae bacterium]
MILIILMAVVAIVAVVIIMKKGKDKSGNSVGEVSDNKVELDKTPASTIHFSDEFKSGEPITKTDNDHTITTILISKEDSFIWVCPSCETENPLSRKKCCVCHHVK